MKMRYPHLLILFRAQHNNAHILNLAQFRRAQVQFRHRAPVTPCATIAHSYKKNDPQHDMTTFQSLAIRSYPPLESIFTLHRRFIAKKLL